MYVDQPFTRPYVPHNLRSVMNQGSVGAILPLLLSSVLAAKSLALSPVKHLLEILCKYLQPPCRTRKVTMILGEQLLFR